MRVRRLLVLAVLPCLALPPAVAAAGPKGLPSAPAKALAWLPPDVTWVTHQGPGRIALLSYARESLGDRRPACFDRLAGQIDHLFQVSRFAGDRGGVNAVHGLADRAALERCASETFRVLAGAPVAFEREGPLTRATVGGRPLYLAWSDDGWLYFGDDPSTVTAMLKRGAAPTLAPSLRPLLARVSLAEPFWTVAAEDLTTRFVGVPSVGLVVPRLGAPPGKDAQGSWSMAVTLIFADERYAERGAGALGIAAWDDRLPQALRGGLVTMHPRRRGREVEVDMGWFFTDRAAAEAALAVMKDRAGRR